MDRRPGTSDPSAAQRDRVRALDATVRWNRFGTPRSLIRPGGPLATNVPGKPAGAARSFLAANRVLFGLSERAVDGLRVVGDVALRGRPGAHVVTFAQHAGTLPVAGGGRITVGVTGHRIAYASSSAIPGATPTPAPKLSARAAWRVAARDVGRPFAPGAIRTLHHPDRPAGWATFDVAGMAQVQRARLVALGFPGAGVRPAYEVEVIDAQHGSSLAVTAYVDAADGTVWVRHGRVDHLRTPAPEPARAKDRWRASRCDPGLLTGGLRAGGLRAGGLRSGGRPPGRGDGAAAAHRAADTSHARVRAWTGALGLPEGRQPRAEIRVRTGAMTGGYPTYAGRNNASHLGLPATRPDRVSLSLFQPVAGRWYGPCTDSAFDPTVIAHELGHATVDTALGGGTSRGTSAPTGGPTGPTSAGARIMAESWADLLAAEQAAETGRPTRAIGGYASGNDTRGLRNYPLGHSPLGYGDLGYDITGPGDDADAGIWSAVNWDIRRALAAAYDAGYPSDDADLQRSCASGRTPVDRCPGNRRWVQLMVDSMLLQQPGTDLLDGRDALLAADRMRFGGDDTETLWHAFARRGMGPSAKPGRPDHTSPAEADGTLIFDSLAHPDGSPVPGARIYLGRYTARADPVADTDPDTELPGRVSLVPGRYTLTWVAPGHGMNHTRVRVAPATTSRFTLHLQANLAAAARGATIAEHAPGRHPGALIDEDESTDWTRSRESGDARGAHLAVDLAGDRPRTIRAVRVSAMLHPVRGPGGVTPQNRFTAVRAFALEACTRSATVSCDAGGRDGGGSGWHRFYTSPPDAFPGVRPRPVTPDLAFREFAVPETRATDVRLVVLDTQCTGGPAYRGEQETDPLSSSDCLAAPASRTARVAELMVYAHRTGDLPPADNHNAWG